MRVQRTVQIKRLLIVGIIAGAALGAFVTLLLPVQPDGFYTIGQVSGFMAVMGAALGLLAAALVSLLLNVAAKRKKGTALAVREQLK